MIFSTKVRRSTDGNGGIVEYEVRVGADAKRYLVPVSND